MLHPAVSLLAWVVLALTAQFVGLAGLLALAALPLFGGLVARQRWYRLLLRAKWLLLTIFIVISYAEPGVLWGGMAWAPSREGIALASRHALSLVVILGGLAWLLSALSRQQLLQALWVASRYLLPATWADRSVARLTLVFDYLASNEASGDWRALLKDAPLDAVESVRLPMANWRERDVAAALLVLLAGGLFGALA